MLENVAKENILNGIRKSYDNAGELIDEAEILRDNQKWPRAYSLCQLAVEEFGKAHLLFQLLIDRYIDAEIDYREINRIFYKHQLKTSLSNEGLIARLTMFQEFSGTDSLNNFIENIQESNNQVRRLDKLKNESLYVSIISNDFQSPNEIISQKDFENIYSTALLRQLVFQFLSRISEKELREVVKMLKEQES